MSLAADLKSIVGPDWVSTRETDRLIYSVDAYWMPQMWLDRGAHTPAPDVIVHPGSTEDVAAIILAANRARVPVIPWGGGSGTQGGVLPIHGGVMVDHSNLAAKAHIISARNRGWEMLTEGAPGTGCRRPWRTAARRG